MNNQDLAMKIRSYRKRKGFSQEQLSENSGVSLRTVQRIENGESEPRGDTLLKLTEALEITTKDLFEKAPAEDKGYLIFLNSSAISVLLNPILGVLIPLIFWIIKRKKIKQVDETGKNLISFQITWMIFLYMFIIIATKGLVMPFNFNFLYYFLPILMELSLSGIGIIFLYLFNLVLIFINVKRSQQGLESKYVPAIPFLR